MAKLKVGEIYRVGGNSGETGNIIKITAIDEDNDVTYETVCNNAQAKDCFPSAFNEDSPFAEKLTLVTPKFKVGDKVRILDGSKIDGYTGGWFDCLADKIGKIMTVACVREGYLKTNSAFGYEMYEDSKLCVYDERGLELDTEKKRACNCANSHKLGTIK